MSLAQQIKTELNKLGIKPKKSMGQNFLVNSAVYRKIIAAADIQKEDVIVEVGPGLGTLTQYLLDAGITVVAVEKDHKLVEYLKQRFSNQKNAKIVEDDILKFDPLNTKYWILDTGYKIVGNIPYYLTSHLLRIIFEDWPQPMLIVLMVQKEVAQRICAKPPNMSLLAVSVQYYAEPKIISYVSKNSFWPAPEVDSAIIRLTSGLQVTGYRLQEKEKKGKSETWPLKPETFFKVVKAGFAGKRKQLGNNLARGLGIQKDKIEEKLKAAGIESTRRAETLTLAEWQNIVTTFLPH